jgi:hypothetical protein
MTDAGPISVYFRQPTVTPRYMKQFTRQTELSARITAPHKASPIQDAHTRQCIQIAQPPEIFHVFSFTAKPVIGISGTVTFLGTINYIYRLFLFIDLNVCMQSINIYFYQQ